ncbi:hypothetical protein FRZ40_35550 [Paraburkholderia azotifigens]|uniref:Uncharacterized protein n=1 Tax=Paraburkholderia azotifigens TaxID=2057004 RepID=A0A5C6V526_9BURK|nr:hypothetical protein FRZ40_35550 [Paraburkholderia azotifigens]
MTCCFPGKCRPTSADPHHYHTSHALPPYSEGRRSWIAYKKGMGINPQLLSNREKTMLVDALKQTYGLPELLGNLCKSPGIDVSLDYPGIRRIHGVA